MEQQLKQRLVGAIVLILLAVIFIPMFLSNVPITEIGANHEQHSSAQADSDFSSSLVPVPTPLDETVDPQKPPVPVSEIKMIEEGVKTELPQAENKQADRIKSDIEIEKQGKNEKPILVEEKIPAEPQSNAQISDSQKAADIKTTVGATQAWVVQLGSFNSEQNANTLNQRLLDKKFQSFVEPLLSNDKSKITYRVRVGPPTLDKAEAEKIKQQIKKAVEMDGYLVKYP